MDKDNYKTVIIIFILVVINLFLIVALFRSGNKYIETELDKDELSDDVNRMNNDLANLQKLNKQYVAIKNADENIFDMIRCINVPTKNVCKDTKDPQGTSGQVCRARLVDCNKYRLIIENDPVALDRIKLINQGGVNVLATTVNGVNRASDPN